MRLNISILTAMGLCVVSVVAFPCGCSKKRLPVAPVTVQLVSSSNTFVCVKGAPYNAGTLARYLREERAREGWFPIVVCGDGNQSYRDLSAVLRVTSIVNRHLYYLQLNSRPESVEFWLDLGCGPEVENVEVEVRRGEVNVEGVSMATATFAQQLSLRFHSSSGVRLWIRCATTVKLLDLYEFMRVCSALKDVRVQLMLRPVVD